ncbi:hypothetical protein [Streptomyces sp. AcE210]|uniref:hypothetical protein n=1 Tax=Streptomyces sp. AcE210 TaxID=2292703 RepID=UPI001058F5CF|nr:hypothetical protein [Streptomyces sp. AcE210]
MAPAADSAWHANHRQNRIELPPPAVTGDAVEDLLADRDTLAEALNAVPNLDGWGPFADEAAFSEQLGAAVAEADGDEGAEQAARLTHREARAMHDEYVQRQCLQAEDELRGVVLANRRRPPADHMR